MDGKLNKTIDISVIIPVYNREKTIVNCINSILNQTYLPKEIIVVDDGSVDNTIDKVKKLNSTLLKIINNKVNKGAQHVRNQGIRSAKYDWIAFLDSDDSWEPSKLRKQVETIINYGNDPYLVINSKCTRVFELNNKTEIWELPIIHGPSKEVYKKLLLNPGPMFQGMLTSKLALEKIGYLDESIISFQEWDTAISLSKICKFHWINEPLFTYYISNKETTFRNKDVWITGYLSIVKKNKTDIIQIYSKTKFTKLIYNSIKQVGVWKYWKFYKKLKQQYKNELNYYQLFKLNLFYILKLNPLRVNSFKNFLNNPINGTKHFIKTIFIKIK